MADDLAPDLKSTIQRMIDAGEPEENIGQVIQHYNTNVKPKPVENNTGVHEPDTFAMGVLRSLGSGEAGDAGERGGRAFIKGATLDIPQSLMGGLQNIANLVSDPKGTIAGIPDTLRSMWDTTKKAGGDPEAFGEMMGQATGQPAVMAGMGKVLGSPIAGKVYSGVGKVMEEHQPLSGLAPRWMMPPTARLLESAIGRGLQNIGQRLTTPTVQGEVVNPLSSGIKEGQVVDNTKQLPPATTRFQQPRTTPDTSVPQLSADNPPPQVLNKNRMLPPSSASGESITTPTSSLRQLPEATKDAIAPPINPRKALLPYIETDKPVSPLIDAFKDVMKNQLSQVKPGQTVKFSDLPYSDEFNKALEAFDKIKSSVPNIGPAISRIFGGGAQ